MGASRFYHDKTQFSLAKLSKIVVDCCDYPIDNIPVSGNGPITFGTLTMTSPTWKKLANGHYESTCDSGTVLTIESNYCGWCLFASSDWIVASPELRYKRRMPRGTFRTLRDAKEFARKLIG